MRLLLVILAALTAAAPGRGQTHPGPWEHLAGVRDGLEAAAPLAADFTQTYLPSGFSTGDTETGRVVLALPRCLRWDYGSPFPKSFLLCGNTAWSWNPGETSGRRYEVPPEERLGLDLLRLSVGDLEGAYSARIAGEEGSRVEIALEPLAGSEAGPRIARATLVLDTAERRLLEVGYEDVDGNRTRFVLGRYRPIDEAGVLEPPSDIEWLEG